MQHRDKQVIAMPTLIAHSDMLWQWEPLKDRVKARKFLLSTLLSTGIMRDRDRGIEQGIERIETVGKGKTYRVPLSALQREAGSSSINELPTLFYWTHLFTHNATN